MKSMLEIEINELKAELKERNNYISLLHMNILEIEKIKDDEIKNLKNELNEFMIKNHKLIKEIDYLNDYINDLEKYN